MDTRKLIELISSHDAPLDAAVLRAAAARLEQQQSEVRSQAQLILQQERELMMAEAQRLHLEARNRELLARCDLLSCELLQVGRKSPLRRTRFCSKAISSTGLNLSWGQRPETLEHNKGQTGCVQTCAPRDGADDDRG